MRVQVLVGYGETADDIPTDIVHALLMTVARLDAQRGDCDDGADSVYAMKNSVPSIIPNSALPLLAPYTYRHLTVA